MFDAFYIFGFHFSQCSHSSFSSTPAPPTRSYDLFSSPGVCHSPYQHCSVKPCPFVLCLTGLLCCQPYLCLPAPQVCWYCKYFWFFFDVITYKYCGQNHVLITPPPFPLSYIPPLLCLFCVKKSRGAIVSVFKDENSKYITRNKIKSLKRLFTFGNLFPIIHCEEQFQRLFVNVTIISVAKKSICIAKNWKLVSALQYNERIKKVDTKIE